MGIKERFESCVLKVKDKQPKNCKSKKWKGKGCVNPWAICNSSVYGLRRSTGKYSMSKPRRSLSRRASRRKATMSNLKRSASRGTSKRKATTRKIYRSKSKRIASKRAPRRKASMSKRKSKGRSKGRRRS